MISLITARPAVEDAADHHRPPAIATSLGSTGNPIVPP
jgi:hypothetical protein